jgi:hypothetical protein
METLIIQTQSKSTSKLLVALVQKLGDKVNVLDKDIADDFAFGLMMQAEKTGRNISKESILAALSK